jgi:hypothetical protein
MKNKAALRIRIGERLNGPFRSGQFFLAFVRHVTRSLYVSGHLGNVGIGFYRMPVDELIVEARALFRRLARQVELQAALAH